MGLRAEWITDDDRFAALAAPWDRLAARDGTPFSLHRWYTAWWHAFGTGATLRTVVLWDGDELAAAFPGHQSGGELRLLANTQTPVARILFRDAAALEALVAEVAANADRACLVRLPAGEASTRTLVEGIHEGGRLTLDEPDQVSPFVALDGSWEDYRSRMKRRWSSADRKGRKMARDHGATFTMVERPSDLEAQLERGLAVEASGWKGQAGTAILSQPDSERFYREIAATYAAAGELALSEILFEGRCVAFDFCLLHGRRLYLLKTGFDEQFGSLSPGLVLRQETIRRCFELGLETHELLGDDSEWKRRFATGERRHVTVRVLPRTPRGVVGYGYRKRLRPKLRSVYRAAKARRAR
ncbi:MAG TPA: GNAT family N-acetyltransferase [Thermoleophilaceae bacterium]|nr:GNAT family N-acetyltransferase [Thermoleophilaceae bacterium]